MTFTGILSRLKHTFQEMQKDEEKKWGRNSETEYKKGNNREQLYSTLTRKEKKMSAYAYKYRDSKYVGKKNLDSSAVFGAPSE